MSGMTLLPRIRLVVVATPESLRGVSIPPNVTVRFNVPLPQTMAILQQARFSVVPLLGTEVPCGHVTLVSAMHLGKASIVSESTGITDYVNDLDNGLTAPPFDPAALARAIARLWDDAALNQRLAEQARSFAGLKCSEPSAVDYL